MARVSQIISWLIIGTFSLIPVFFLPLTENYYDFNKWVLLVSSALLLISLWSVYCWRSKSIVISVSPGATGMAALSVASLISLALASFNRFEGITNLFGPATYLALSVFLVLGGPFLTPQAKKALRWGLYISASIAGVVAIYQFFGVGKAMFPGITALANPLWTPLGSTVSAVLFLIMVLPLAAGDLIHHFKSNHENQMIGAAIVTILVLAGLAITLYQLIPLVRISFLPLRAGWEILLTAIKNPFRLMFGVGSENFLNAFTQGRPVWLNATPVWNIRFIANASFALHILTVFGVLGGIGLFGILRALITGITYKPIEVDNLALNITKLLSVVILLIAPINLTFLVLVTAIFLLAENSGHQIYKKNLNHAQLVNILPLTICIASIVLGFFVFKEWFAQYAYYRYIVLRNEGKGIESYKALIDAIQRSTETSRFHLALSEISLTLAYQLAANSQLQNQASRPPLEVATAVSQQDRQTITKFVQQALREAKYAIKLAPNSILAWENLGLVYESMSRVTQGALQWTVTTYQKVVELDPSNPDSRLKLGGAYVAGQVYAEGQNQYRAAVTLKPDYANAHYNLSYVYRQQGKNLEAAYELKIAQRLIPPESDDYKAVAKDLEMITGRLTYKEKAELEKLSSNVMEPAGTVSPLSGDLPDSSININLGTKPSPTP